jgi:hypothetical protein
MPVDRVAGEVPEVVVQRRSVTMTLRLQLGSEGRVEERW